MHKEKVLNSMLHLEVTLQVLSMGYVITYDVLMRLHTVFIPQGGYLLPAMMQESVLFSLEHSN